MKTTYEDIVQQVQLFEDPKLETICPSTGKNAGQDVDVLTLKTFHAKFIKQDDGTRKRGECTFYTVKFFGDKAKYYAPLLKNGLRIEVRGAFSERSFTGKDGKQHYEKIIHANQILIPINQVGLKDIVFIKSEEEKDK